MVCANYLKSHLALSPPKALHSRTRGYLSYLCRALCPEESYFSFCSPFTATEFLAAAANFLAFITTGPEIVAYAMLKNSLCSDITSVVFLDLYMPFLPSRSLQDRKTALLNCFLPAYLSLLFPASHSCFSL